MEVTDVFITKCYDINDAEKVPIIKNWLGGNASNLYRHLQKQEEELNRFLNLFVSMIF